MKLNKNDIINAIKGIGIVTTQSGPVVPAKSKMIEVLTKDILKPITKPQDSDNWDNRKYDMNPVLSSNKKYTVKDMYSKVAKAVTEAMTKTPYHGMRLNLKSIDMEETHCKFIITRKEQKVMVELYYPNANKAISVHITTEGGESNLYEVALDSPQFRTNFGITILKSIDELLGSTTSYNLADDIENSDMTTGMGTPVDDVGNTLVQPSAMIRESIDSGLSKLLKICNEAADEAEIADDNAEETAAAGTDGQDPEAAAFAEDPNTMSPDQIAMGDNNAMGGVPVNAGNVNSTEDKGALEIQTFRDFLLEKLGKSADGDNLQTINDSDDNGKGSVVGNIKELVAQRLADKNEHRTINEVKKGTLGVENQKASASVEAFLELYDDLANSDQPIEKMEKLLDYLEDPQEEINLKNFDAKLKELFPSLYPDSTASDFTNTDNLYLDGESTFASADNQNDTINFDAFGIGGGDMGDDFSFGADLDYSNGDPNMVDQLQETLPDGDENSEDNPFGDMTVGPKEDAANALPNLNG